MSQKNYTSVHHLTQADPTLHSPQPDPASSISHPASTQSKKPRMPVSHHGKESEPYPQTHEVLSKSEEQEVEEAEPQVKDPEVAKYMQIENKEELYMDPKLKKAGLQAIDTTTLDPRYKVKLPISDEKIMEGLEKPMSSPYRWLAEFARYILKKSHLTIKKIHGHVVRIMIQ